MRRNAQAQFAPTRTSRERGDIDLNHCSPARQQNSMDLKVADPDDADLRKDITVESRAPATKQLLDFLNTHDAAGGPFERPRHARDAGASSTSRKRRRQSGSLF